ncbi:DNA repair protein complementing XP-G cells-like [Agrilus planipennis]|uniref:DNA repair protein complementing XP-G cells-like n=1 Tax=Agrilus planipennis TaxID=224129 RepID=A0A1W4W5Q5_AGRPL|nr:DNA repair protein complementing XP-G cells-like [Agrilus planipennis]
MSDSDSSDDLLEVPTNESRTPTKTSGSSFEITIQPSELLQDDLFSDIFSKSLVSGAKTSTKTYTQNAIIRNTLSRIPEETNDIENRKLNKEIANYLNETISKKTESIAFSKKTEKKPEEELTKETVMTTKSNVNISESNNKSIGLTTQENKEKVVKELLQTLKDSNTVYTNENNTPEKAVDFLNTNQLKEIQRNLVEEQNHLISEKSNKERLATNITDQMYQEAQELLQLFGVPYIIAPMEAEAQCAFLDLINLTDGTITDDSDIWLFGGKTVYKNFFNQNKYVLEFKSEDIEHHFKLTREQMILLALLVGSDYTVGIQGIGPVTALEVLAAFPPSKVTEFSLSHQQLLSGLLEFRSWLTGGKSIPGKTSLRNKLKNVVFTENFPSYQVVQAYLDPKVDTSKEPFSWAKPDIVALTDFARDKFGWTRFKSEEILKPVLKRLEEKHIQKSIRNYFKTKYKLHSTETEAKMSKRVQKAIQKIGTEPIDSLDEDQTSEKRAKKKKNATGIEQEKLQKTKKTKFNKTIATDANTSKQDTDFVENPGRVKAEASNKISNSLSVLKGKKLKSQKTKKDSQVKITRKTKELQKIEKNDDTNNNKLSENSESIEEERENIDKQKQSNSKKAIKKQVSESTWSLSAPVTEEINKVQQSNNNPKGSGIDDVDVVSVSRELNETDSNKIGSPADFNQPSTSTAIIPKRPKNTSKNNKKQKIDINEVINGGDEEMRILQDVITHSKSKVEQIRLQLTNQLKRNTRSTKEPKEIIRDVSGPISPLDRLKTENIHKKEVIPQKIQDNLTMMRSKMKAIEVLKTKKNATKKRPKIKRMTHIGTHYLSESSSDEDIKKA